MYIIRNMSYSTSEKPKALEPKRFTHPLRVQASKNGHQMVSVSDTTYGGELTLLKTLSVTYNK